MPWTPRLGYPTQSPVAARLAGAIALSLALHGAVVLTLAAAPQGALSGEGNRTGAPLHARLAAAGARTFSPTPGTPHAGARDPRPERAPAPLARAAGAPLPEGPAQAFGVLPDTLYYPASELDVRPRPTMPVDPPYPRVAPPDGGYLVLELLISETGAVERVHVAVADPEGFFEQTAIDAFMATRYTPGRRDGVPVKSRTWVELRFHPLAPPAVTAAADADSVPP